MPSVRPRSGRRRVGIPTELLRVSSPRPLTALLELTDERRAGLLVFGPERRRLSRRRFRAATRAVRNRAGCLGVGLGRE